MPLEMLMKLIRHLRPRAAHILVVEPDDGYTFMKATFNPHGTLQALNGAGLLTHRWEALDTAYAEEIALRVGAQLNLLRVDAFGPWYVADFDDVMRIMHDFDLETGRRMRDARFEVGQRVQVTGAGRGHITEIRGSRVVVKLENPTGPLECVVASRSLVKPVLTMVCDRGLPGAA
jgi:hypothetical protein